MGLSYVESTTLACRYSVRYQRIQISIWIILEFGNHLQHSTSFKGLHLTWQIGRLPVVGCFRWKCGTPSCKKGRPKLRTSCPEPICSHLRFRALRYSALWAPEISQKPKNLWHAQTYLLKFMKMYQPNAFQPWNFVGLLSSQQTEVSTLLVAALPARCTCRWLQAASSNRNEGIPGCWWITKNPSPPSLQHNFLYKIA